MLGWISNIFKPAAKLIDDLHFSGEEKAISKAKLAQLKNEFATIQAQANAKFIDLEMTALQARKEVMIAEAQSSSLLQTAWRPMCSILLIMLVVLDSFDIVTADEQLYTLATAFLGLYTAGRSTEKAAKVIKLGTNRD